MDLRILEELGLSTAEAKIYIALLELGQAKTGRIIDVTKLQSSTVYHILGSLVEKGLVSYIMSGKIKFYQAESPESLLTFLEEKKKKLNLIMPELKDKEQSSKIKQNAKVFEGVRGLQVAYNDVLETMNPGEEYYFFQFPYEKFKEEKVKLFFHNYHLKRSEKKIKVRGIGSPDCKELMNEIYGLPFTKVRFLEEPTPNAIVIYKNKVLMIDWEDNPIAFTIQSKTIYNSYKQFFLDKWEKAIP